MAVISMYDRRKARGLKAVTGYMTEESARKIKVLAAGLGLTLGETMALLADHADSILPLNGGRQLTK